MTTLLKMVVSLLLQGPAVCCRSVLFPLPLNNRNRSIFYKTKNQYQGILYANMFISRYFQLAVIIAHLKFLCYAFGYFQRTVFGHFCAINVAISSSLALITKAKTIPIPIPIPRIIVKNLPILTEH